MLRRVIALTGLLLAGTLFTAGGRAAAALSPLTSYHVGNSLTWDADPNAVASMAAARGHVQNVGYHIACGQSLPAITDNAPWTCIPPTVYGMYDTALPQYAWDVVTAQPFPSGGSTLGGDVSSFAKLMGLAAENPANAHTQWYIYQAYPSQAAQQPDYDAAWLRQSSGRDDQWTMLARDYFDDLLPRVNEIRPAGLPAVRVIPVGEVMYEAAQRIRSGQLRGLTSVPQLYRDGDHLGLAGKFLAASTWYATLFGEDPTGIPFPSGNYEGQTLDPVLVNQLESLAWDVVSTHPDTGVAPEPTGFLMAGIFSLGLATRRRRQRSR